MCPLVAIYGNPTSSAQQDGGQDDIGYKCTQDEEILRLPQKLINGAFIIASGFIILRNVA